MSPQVAKILLKHLLRQNDLKRARVVLQKDWMTEPLMLEEAGGILSELQVMRADHLVADTSE